MKAVNDPGESLEHEVEDIDREDVDNEVIDDEEEEDVGDQTIVMSDDDFEDDADISMEVNVEKLVAEFEKADSDDLHRRAEIRRRLEELTETGELEDTYALEYDD